MRVLWVLKELRPSGVEVALRVAAPLWSRHGLEVEVVGTGPVPGPYASELRDAGYTVHHVSMDPSWKFIPAYARLLRQRHYDVVNVHLERGNLYTAGMAKVLGVKAVVRTVQNVFRYRGRLGLQRRVQRALLRRLGVVHVAISPSVQAAESEYFGNPSRIIHDWYDEQRFHPPTPDQTAKARCELGIAPDDFAIASVGNCSHIKNHSALIKAIGSIHGEIPVKYLHVGLEEDEGSERVLVAEHGLNGAARFLGQVNDVVPVLHAADCYAMPSLYEGLGIAAIEALACGVPSILSDVAGLRDLREPFRHIWYVDHDSPTAIAHALRQIHDLDADTRRSLQEELTASARKYFSSHECVGGYVSLYRSLTGQTDEVHVSRRAAE